MPVYIFDCIISNFFTKYTFSDSYNLLWSVSTSTFSLSKPESKVEVSSSEPSVWMDISRFGNKVKLSWKDKKEKKKITGMKLEIQWKKEKKKTLDAEWETRQEVNFVWNWSRGFGLSLHGEFQACLICDIQALEGLEESPSLCEERTLKSAAAWRLAPTTL